MKKKLEEIIKNSYSVCCFINDYETLEKVLDEIEEINSLPENILHDFILSSIETVINDVLELNCMLDKYNTEFLDIAAKLNVSEYDGELIKNYQITQEKLKVINKLSELAEKCLDKLLNICTFNESVKCALKLEIPELYENIFCLVDAEEELAEYLYGRILSFYKLEKDEKLKLINKAINDFVLDIENYINLDDNENKRLVKTFYKERAKLKKRLLELEETEE